MTSSYHPWTQWIGIESIEQLYADGIRRYGGSGSLPQVGCVEAALGAAYNAELYSPESIEEGALEGLLFACFLLFYLVEKHCYTDGNKRISWACMTFVLLSFGLTIEATEDETVEFCLSIARGEVEGGMAVTQWVFPRLKSVI